MLLNVIARPGDAFAAMRHLLADNHEEPRRPAPAHPPGHRHLPGAARRRGGRAARRARRDRPHGPAHRRPAGRLRAQPAAVAVRAGRARAARPGVPDVRARRRCRSSSRPSTTRARCSPPSSSRPAARRSPQMKAEGIEYEERMELLEDGHLPQAAGRAARGRVRDLPAGPPVGRRPRAVAQVRGPRHVRAGDDLRRVRRLLRAGPLRGPGAALPRRRVQGAAADRARGAPRPRSWSTSSSGSASWSARSTPACSTSGSS